MREAINTIIFIIFLFLFLVGIFAGFDVLDKQQREAREKEKQKEDAEIYSCLDSGRRAEFVGGTAFDKGRVVCNPK